MGVLKFNKKKNNTELTYYDRQIRSPLRICIILYISYILISLFIPLYDGYVMGFTSGFNYLAIIISGVGVYAMHGHFNQIVPLPILVLLRLIQFIYRFVMTSSYHLNLISFIILVVFEIFLCILEMIDRATFEYVKEKGEI